MINLHDEENLIAFYLMANLFAPVIPNGCAKLAEILSMGELSWNPVTLPELLTFSEVPILYARIDEKDE